MASAQVNSFLAVIKYQSFSKAADHLYVSQSAISKNVAQLEKNVGYLLIDRSGGFIRPTPVGKLFYEHYLEAEEQYQALLKQVELLTAKQADDIRLGCLDGWDLSQFYPQIRNIFKEKYPGVTLNLEGYDHIKLLDALSDDRIDVGISLSITVPKQSRFVSRTIATVPAIMMISSTHTLAQKEDLQLIDFKDEPFYVVAPTPQEINPMLQLTLELCHNAGFAPNIELAPNSATILMRLQSGIGVQVTSQWTCASHFPIYKTYQLDKMLGICAVWINDGKTPSKHLFVNELMKLDIDNSRI